MKSVLISIQPKWCELIATGKKTVEVRKTRPKIETPFKCYIYCTKGETIYLPRDIFGNKALNGKVIGEFVCDRITEYECSSDGFGELATTCGTCLTYDEIINYCNGNDLYGWHISDLVIYDKPRALSGFKRACPDNVYECAMCRHSDYTGMKCTPITRPPQSWCYVEGEQQ
jgi:predicted transcriptional regulator